MARRVIKIKRNWPPDPVYNSIAVTRFINNLMKDGKKVKSQNIFYRAMKYIENKTKKDAFEIFQTALKNVAPQVEVWSRRLGGATFQVPREVRKERKFSKAVKWIIKAVRNRKNSPMYIRLAEELIAAANQEGEAYRMKVEIHKQAEADKAFAHLGWWNRKRPPQNT